jgi:predicted  nucleic acid-binding Zn-ribbon protein
VPNQIVQLLELQAIDQSLTEASERIKRLQRERVRLDEKVAEADQNYAQQKEDLKLLEHQSLMRNLAVDELDANIRAYQHRLDTGIISFKEMEDLQAKIISERHRIGEMEDEALQMMESIARQKSALVDAERALAERHAELKTLAEEVDANTHQATASIERLHAQRAELEASMTDFLLSQYESLRKKFEDPVAVVDHATCSGCKLKLSGSTIERARGSLGLVTCEHCSRILYVQ